MRRPTRRLPRAGARRLGNASCTMRVEPQHARRATLATTEHQHLLDQVPRALAGASRLRQVAAEARVGLRRLPLAREHDVAHDRRQQVVEVVRDAAGQLADGLHLLRLSQPRFESSRRRSAALRSVMSRMTASTCGSPWYRIGIVRNSIEKRSPPRRRVSHSPWNDSPASVRAMIRRLPRLDARPTGRACAPRPAPRPANSRTCVRTPDSRRPARNANSRDQARLSRHGTRRGTVLRSRAVPPRRPCAR